VSARRTTKRLAKKTPKRVGKRTERVRWGGCRNTGYKLISADNSKNPTIVFLDNIVINCDENKNCKGEHRLYQWAIINNNKEEGYLEVYKEGWYRISSTSKVGGVQMYKEKWSCSECVWERTGTSRNDSIYKIKDERPC